jgi:hypothetical protein
MAAYAAAMPPGIPARLDEPVAATLPADDIALTVFNSINYQLAQLQQCLVSKS